MTNTVAQTILSQLGGNKFLAMTGARHMIGGENSLTFQIAGRGCNRARITLDGSDTYTVETFAIRSLKCNRKACETDIYDDGLRGSFERLTGLYTSL